MDFKKCTKLTNSETNEVYCTTKFMLWIFRIKSSGLQVHPQESGRR